MDRAPDEQPGDQSQPLQLTRAERELARRIAYELGERQPGQQALIRRIVHALGTDLSLVFLREAQKTERQGGMLLADGKTRRTKGGVFFRLVKDQAPQHGYPNISTLFWQRPQRKGPPPPPTSPKERPDPLTWPERLGILAALAEGNTGMITTAVLKVIGKAGEHHDHPGGCTVLRLTSTIQPAVPRGVPTPQDTPTVYVVYLGSRLWGRIAKAAADPEDEIIVEGFPQIDTETGTIALYARKTTSKKLEAERFQKTRRPEQQKPPQEGEEST
jgi:PHAX RNA-binding domain